MFHNSNFSSIKLIYKTRGKYDTGHVLLHLTMIYLYEKAGPLLLYILLASAVQLNYNKCNFNWHFDLRKLIEMDWRKLYNLEIIYKR